MKRMNRLMSKKSHSWWWDSHISPKNSKWLGENLEEMDRCVKTMLKLIEEEGDSFAKKAEMYYKRRPELASHVEEFYRMYRSLAERYDNVTGELRKRLPSELRTQGSGSESDFNSEVSSPSAHSAESTPESKPPRPKRGPRAAGFDFFLGSGGSSDLSKKGSDKSSSSSDSCSESDDEKDANGDCLSERIFELENELCNVKEKLQEYEERFPNGSRQCEGIVDDAECISKASALEEELASLSGKLHESELEILDLKEKLEGRHTSTVRDDANETEMMAEQRREIEALKSKIEVSLCQHKSELSERDEAIETLKAELADASRKFLQEKSHLVDDISRMEGNVQELKTELEKLANENSRLESVVLDQERAIMELKAIAAGSADVLSLEKASLEAKFATLSAELEELSNEKSRIESIVSKQGQIIEELKATSARSADEFSLERASISVKVVALSAELEKLVDEKSRLDTVVSQREETIKELKATTTRSTEEFLLEKACLEAKIAALSASHGALEAELVKLEGRASHLESDKAAMRSKEHEKFEERKSSMESLSLKVDLLASEKQELVCRIYVLTNDVKSRDDRIREMDEHLDALHLEHAILMTEAEEARRALAELRDRADGLQEEVDRQRVTISDGNEGKREAIRQLCFSLEHYRVGYLQLKQQLLLHGHNRLLVAA